MRQKLINPPYAARKHDLVLRIHIRNHDLVHRRRIKRNTRVRLGAFRRMAEEIVDRGDHRSHVFSLANESHHPDLLAYIFRALLKHLPTPADHLQRIGFAQIATRDKRSKLPQRMPQNDVNPLISLEPKLALQHPQDHDTRRHDGRLGVLRRGQQRVGTIRDDF